MDGPRAVVFDLRGEHRPSRSGGGPLAVVCGLPILARNLLVLRRAGLGQAVLVLAAEDRPLVERMLAREPRAAAALPWTVREVQGSGRASALAAAREAAPGAELLYWPGALTCGRFAPALATAVIPEDGMLAGEAGLALVGPRAGDGEPSPAPADPDRPAQLVLDRAGLRRAEAALLVSLRKPADGVVARFDRYVSLAVSRRLMRLPVTPNQVTVAAGLLGIVCGLLAAHGGYSFLLAGALGFQLNSILDGIDGEIARAKLHESRIGAWLDTIADDASNLAFTTGACIGCYRTWGSAHYLVLGVVVAFGFLVTAALMYHYLITVAHSGDLNDFKMPWDEHPGPDAGGPTAATPGEATAGAPSDNHPSSLTPGFTLSSVLARLKFIIRRDVFVFLTTLFALAGQMWIMVWLYAAGATAVWTTIVGYRVILPLFRGGRA